MTFHDSPWPDGTPCWVDLMAPDRKRAMEFYGSLLGWDFGGEGSAETGFYTMALIDGRPVAGQGEMAADGDKPPAWTTYLAVSDIDKIVTAITEAGGQVFAPPMDVMSAGRMAVVADPTGAVFGLWQAGDHIGTQVTGKPGTQAWNELMTRDFEAAKAFYTTVFGFQVDDISGEGFTYATLMVDGKTVGGLGGMPDDVPAEVPAHWVTYFAVRDADASAAKVTELGGTVTSPPFDSPHGKIAMVADNQGARFNVVAPNEQSGKPEGWED